VVLFFEYLLDEFYDSHLILNTNRASSYRLYAPIYGSFKDGKTIITEVWSSQISEAMPDVVGAEVMQINGVDFQVAIDNFPTRCSDKQAPEVREWIGNKVLAGRYNEPRKLTLKLRTGRVVDWWDMNTVAYRANDRLLTTKRTGNLGVIRLLNSLGKNELINAFDQALEELWDTEGLVLDLRNTVDGGNTYVARGIMGRFITEAQPYQRHWTRERYDGGPAVERSWVEYVSPRGETYTKPVVVLVGRWTGSMGEGTAIGMDGMGRAEIVGTEMERLAGEVDGFSFKHQSYGYRISWAKLFHIDGTPREAYVPKNYVRQTTRLRDEILEAGLELLKKKVAEE